MLKSLFIVIDSDSGDTPISLKIALSDKERMKLILGEPYLISRLIKDAEDYLKLKAEMTKPTPGAKIDYKVEGVKRANIKRR